MVELVILVPVLRRPRNLQPLIASIHNSTREPFTVLFIVSPSDTEETRELKRLNQAYTVMDDNYEGRGDYARKINTGFDSIEANWYFLGADDLSFQAGWFEEAMETYAATEACVIGTNDLGNPRVIRGEHATHSLVLRDYILKCGTIDEPGKILYEGYYHNFVDNELVETAKWRGAWAFAFESKVRHIHPNWGLTQRDEVYDLGKKNFDKDKALFEQRRHLWL